MTILVLVRRDLTRADEMKDPEVEADSNLQAEEVVANFFRAVRAGCFGRDRQVTSLEEKQEASEYLLRAEIPRLPTRAFEILSRMLEASVLLGSGVQELTVEEQEDISSGPEAVMASSSPSDTRFDVSRSIQSFSKDVCINILVKDHLADDDAAKLYEAIEAWSRLLVGGFPVAELGGVSFGRLFRVTSHSTREVEALLEFYSASEEAWRVLVDALANQSLSSEIERVLID